MEKYDHKELERKWQKKWQHDELYRTSDADGRPKCYVLDMFPYPSGEGLHVGHPKGYIATDVYSRFKTMTGHRILHPMGWDAFGLPAEQFALKNKVHPREAVARNIARFKDQLAKLGFNYDWSREVNTTDPEFYKWTQWIFKRMWKAGLAYESHEPINWCPSCKTGLSNEDLEGGSCERCGTPVEQRAIRQWVLRITKYADRMLADLDTLKWPEHIKESQRNWIGRSEGAEIEFSLNVPGQAAGKHSVTVFTTRPDTIFGATYLAISAELARKWLSVGWKPGVEVEQFVAELEEEEKKRAFDFKEVAQKKGIDTGVKAINPANKEEIPVWIANYVLSGYGTGAIMAVPAHDERDLDFATQFGLPVKQVIAPLFTRTTGNDAVRDDAPWRERRAVMCIVKHWERDEYLCLQWREFPEIRSFVTGGIEGNESPVETGKREIKEETGYLNPEFVGNIGGDKVVEFYHQVKKTNVRARFTYLHFTLRDDERVEIGDEEHAIHTIHWKKRDEVFDFISHLEKEIIWSDFVNGATVFSGDGFLVNSGPFDGKPSGEVKQEIAKFVGGKMVSQYRLKDWVFARQRYWGEPFPIVFDDEHHAYVVADTELPVRLPEVKAYEPTDTGESPLANIRDWVEVFGYLNDDNEFVSCAKKDPRAKRFMRETNTMPQWAGSSWYYLRYIDPTNADMLVDATKEKSWSPVDFYVGGAEHATRHLIYARFWHKFLFDIGVVHHPEPFLRLQSVGLIQAEDGRKMSKRWGNVINPDDIVEKFGADSLRVYEMFMGPFAQAIAWSTDNLVGARRFVERVWRLSERVVPDAPLSASSQTLLHRTIKKVGEDIEEFSFNTAIAQMMTLLNDWEKAERISVSDYKILLQLLAPFAPHVAEELWAIHGGSGSIHASRWPAHDTAKLLTDTITVGVQVNGKLRDTVTFSRNLDETSVKALATESTQVAKWLEGKTPKKVIYVKEKIISIVV